MLLTSGNPMQFKFTNAFKAKILEDGVSAEYGARPLKRVLEKILITPVSRLIESEQLIPGDQVTVGITKGEVTFVRDPRTEEQMKAWEKIKNPPKRRSPAKKPGTKKRTYKKKVTSR